MLPKRLPLHLFIWFWLILSFIALAAFLILRASGYVINLKARTFEKTGLIIVSSEPKGALLYLNGKFKEKTPAKLAYLRPGLYQLKIEKENYEVWEKTEKLEGGQFQKIEAILFLKKPKIEEAEGVKLNKFSNEKEKVILEKEILKSLPKEAQDPSLDKNKKTMLYRTDFEIWLYFLDKPEKERSKIVARFSRPIKKVAFYPDGAHILFLIDNELRIIEIDGQNDTKLLDIETLDFWVSPDGREIFWKTGGGVLRATVR